MGTEGWVLFFLILLLLIIIAIVIASRKTPIYQILCNGTSGFVVVNTTVGLSGQNVFCNGTSTQSGSDWLVVWLSSYSDICYIINVSTNNPLVVSSAVPGTVVTCTPATPTRFRRLTSFSPTGSVYFQLLDNPNLIIAADVNNVSGLGPVLITQSFAATAVNPPLAGTFQLLRAMKRI